MVDRNSYDDLETDYLEEETESGFLSLMSVVIAFIAVAVFIALAWYAYQTGSETTPHEDIEIVYPEEGTIREAPEEPGGWQFPNQDRSVYNVMSGENSDVKVEKILPAPEQPVQRQDLQTQTWMNDELKDGGKSIAKTDAERQMEAKKAEAQESPEEVEKAVAASVEAEEAKAGKTPEPVTKAPDEPEPEIAPKEAEPAPQAVKQPESVKQPEPTSALSTALTRTRLQLGAVRSEQEAQNTWKKISQKHSALLNGKSLHVEKAEIPDKGTYYRLQLYPFADKAEANALCAKLDAQGQPCFALVK